MPPDTTNAVAKAAGAMTATRDPSLRRRSKVPPRSARSCSTARASSVRSRAISRRTASGLRAAVSAIVPSAQGGACQLRLRDRLFRNGRHAAPKLRDADCEQESRDECEAGDDEKEREPGGERSRERGGDRRKQEAEREEGEDTARREQHHARAQGGDLPAHLERCQL